MITRYLRHGRSAATRSLMKRPTGAMMRPLRLEQRRSVVKMYRVSTYLQDVLRTRSLQPPNPILDSSLDSVEGIESDDLAAGNYARRHTLPHFDKVLPYHLDNAAPEVAKQYMLDLAELEVAILNDGDFLRENDIMEVLDRIEAPIYQVLEIGRLMAVVTTSDDKRQWMLALPKAEKTLKGLPKRDSKVVYNALKQQGAPESTLATFRRSGAHEEDEDAKAKFKAIKAKLDDTRQRLGSMVEFGQLTKSEQLQAKSDIYNSVGLSQARAKLLGFEGSVSDMESASEARQATVETVRQLNDDMAATFVPLLEQKVQLDAESTATAFLTSTAKQNKAPTVTEREKVYMQAKWSVRQLLTLDGVLRGAFDLCDGLFGIHIEEELNKTAIHRWDIWERLFHVYDKDAAPDESSDDCDVIPGRYLGSFYLDPYERFDKEDCSAARLFTQRSHCGAPLSIVTLNVVMPMWDDDPIPVSWKDTQNLMFQLGMALQQILSTTDIPSLGKEAAAATVPVDQADFLGHFMALWLRNHGFLRRLANLSQDKFEFDAQIIEILLKEQQDEKAHGLMQNTFLSALELALYTEFDITKNEESLSDLQQRIAEKFISHDLPRYGDLTPLLDVFEQPHEDNQNNNCDNGRIWKAYCKLWSEAVATDLYNDFQQTDRAEYKQMGRRVRDLAMRGSTGDDRPPVVSADAFRSVYEIP